MKTKEEILEQYMDSDRTKNSIHKAMQEFSDQQNAQLREAFLELLYNNYSKQHAKPEINKWLEKAGLEELPPQPTNEQKQ